MFHLEISKNRVNLKEREVLVSGASKSHLVQFAFSSDWEGLNRTAVFRAGEVSRSEVLSHTNQCHIPWEVLEMTGRILWAGVEGTDGEGLVLPTVWCALGCISPGAHPGDDEAQPPTPDVYSQLLAVANKAAETAKSVRDDADAGKFDGADGKDGVDGKDGAPGADGADAPQINDAIITDANPWSSRKIVDTLAPEFETSGAVVTCTPVAGYPLHVVSQIMPVQEGEGDPSPDNVRPIRGWDAANLWVAGKNLWDNDYAMNPDNWEYGTYYALRLPLAPNATYTISMSKNNMVKDYNPDYNGQFAFYLGETPYNSIGNKLIGNTAVLDVPLTYTFSTSDKLMYANLYVGSYGYSGFEIAFTELLVNLQIEAGSTPAIYTPYNPASKTITLPFGQTVYGGALDWTTGVLTVTYAEIASYSGESLPGVWISDRDVYSQGATPTTGAQVVYELAQPQTIQLTPQEILALSGTNNIYADTGDVTVSGRADPNAVINNLAQRIAALEGQAING